jgi:hypothetical protein
MYTQEFLVDAFLSRYLASSSIEQLIRLEDLANKCYNDYGRKRFREFASLDAEAIKLYVSKS